MALYALNAESQQRRLGVVAVSIISIVCVIAVITGVTLLSIFVVRKRSVTHNGSL